MAKAKHYSEIPVTSWNSSHFQRYMQDKHFELYGIHYAAAGGIVAERTQIARYIGTAKRPGLYDKETMKTFIDSCFKLYKPTPQYPGLSFWFMVTYMTTELQKAELSSKRKAAESQVDDWEELDGWF